MEEKCYCYLAPFSAPETDLFSLPSYSILPFFTFNLDHPNGSITHVGLPPQDVCERRGCVRASGWSSEQKDCAGVCVWKEQTDHDRFYYKDQFLQYKEELPAFITLRKDH